MNISTTCLHEPTDIEEGARLPDLKSQALVSHSVGTGNRNQVLSKMTKHSWPLNHLSRELGCVRGGHNGHYEKCICCHRAKEFIVPCLYSLHWHLLRLSECISLYKAAVYEVTSLSLKTSSCRSDTQAWGHTQAWGPLLYNKDALVLTFLRPVSWVLPLHKTPKNRTSCGSKAPQLPVYVSRVSINGIYGP